MENRFGFKDFILYVLLGGVIVLVLLAMVQFDRQWKLVQSIQDQLREQSSDIREIQRGLANGVVVGSGNGMASAATTQASDAEDPFSRLRAARKMPGFAMGDWLVDAFGGGIAKLTPLVSGDYDASLVQGYVQESLADRDPATLEWKPLLAKSWTISPDGLTITFQMRDGVRFSDGHPLTADDVVFTYNFIMNPAIAAPRDRAYLATIAKVEKKGENEVVFTYKEPYFEAFQLAAGMPILPKHFYEKYKPEEFNQSVGLLMGSGPYRLESPTDWKPGTLIQLVRNERYWGVMPALDRLVFKEITNDTARLTAFRNGDIDLFPASPEQYRELLKDKTLLDRTKHYEYLSLLGGYRYVAWNEKRNGQPTRFADKRVRQAMTMLTDRERIIQEIMLGYAVQATGPFSPLSKQNNPNVKPWPYDVARAKSLLAEAGFKDVNGDGVLEGPDGKPFQFKLTYPSGHSNYERLVLFLKDAYAKAGIVLVPDPLEWSVFTERLSNKNFEAITLGWSAGIESDIYQMFHSSQMIAGGDDFISYKNPELDKVIDQARRTVDEGKRMQLWHRAHEILNEDQPYMFLSFGKSLIFMDKRIDNVQKLKIGLNPRVEWFVPKKEQRWTR